MSTLRDELLRLSAEHDRILEPKDVIDAAESADSPLHKYFEWDDSIAGTKYRLLQAQHYIRITVTVLERPDDDPIKVRAFVSLTPDRGPDGFYRQITDVYSADEYRAQMFADVKRELEAIERKYRLLPELAPIFAAMRQVLDSKSAAA